MRSRGGRKYKTPGKGASSKECVHRKLAIRRPNYLCSKNKSNYDNVCGSEETTSITYVSKACMTSNDSRPGYVRKRCGRPCKNVSVISNIYGDLEESDADSYASDENKFYDSDVPLNELEGVFNESSCIENISEVPVPFWLQGNVFPELILPYSSHDLLIPKEHLMDAASIYEILMQFWKHLLISPFIFEDFCNALLSAEQNILLSEIHHQLTKLLIRDDEKHHSSFGPMDHRDSMNPILYLGDIFTWPEVLRCYLHGWYHNGNKCVVPALKVLNNQEYPFVSLSDRLLVLRLLTDLALQSNVIRFELVREPGPIVHEDVCRVCHRTGDLLCCETCTSTYHLDCVDPPLCTVPDHDWHCSVCERHTVKGITDTSTLVARNICFLRHTNLGYDRMGNSYWFVCRRIFVENFERNELVAYYSSVAQYESLLACLDPEYYEHALCLTLNELHFDIVQQMSLTEQLSCERNPNAALVHSYLQQDSEYRKRLLNEMEADRVELYSVYNEENSGADACSLQMKADYYRKSISTESEDDFRGFCLGDSSDSAACAYTNQFSTNYLALTRLQYADEHDKRKHMNGKFSLFDSAEFKWEGKVIGTRAQLCGTLRYTMLRMAEQVVGVLMHSSWSLVQRAWRAAVDCCDKPRDFGSTIALLSALIRPRLYCQLWNDSLAHVHFHRITQFERDERRKQSVLEKRERREIEEDTSSTTAVAAAHTSAHTNCVKYTKEFKHQLWRQKGEEYRLSGSGGWLWVAITRRYCRACRPPLDMFVGTQTQPASARNTKRRVKRPVDGLHLLHSMLYRRLLDLSSVGNDNLKMLIENTFKYKCYSLDCRLGLNLGSCYSPSCFSSKRDCIHLADDLPQVSTELPFAINHLYRSNTDKRRQIRYPQLSRMYCSSRWSMLVLPKWQARMLARRYGQSQVDGFNYSAKNNPMLWIYPCPRAAWKTGWLYRTRRVCSIHAAALQFRILWAVLLWEDMNARPEQIDPGEFQITTDTGMVRSLILKHRDYGRFSEFTTFFRRKVTILFDAPVIVEKEYVSSARSGLRKRRRVIESSDTPSSDVIQEWVPEQQLELFEIRYYFERLLKIKQNKSHQLNSAERILSHSMTSSSSGATTAVDNYVTHDRDKQNENSAYKRAKNQRCAVRPSRPLALKPANKQDVVSPSHAHRLVSVDGKLMPLKADPIAQVSDSANKDNKQPLSIQVLRLPNGAKVHVKPVKQELSLSSDLSNDGQTNNKQEQNSSASSRHKLVTEVIGMSSLSAEQLDHWKARVAAGEARVAMINGRRVFLHNVATVTVPDFSTGHQVTGQVTDQVTGHQVTEQTPDSTPRTVMATANVVNTAHGPRIVIQGVPVQGLSQQQLRDLQQQVKSDLAREGSQLTPGLRQIQLVIPQSSPPVTTASAECGGAGDTVSDTASAAITAQSVCAHSVSTAASAVTSGAVTSADLAAHAAPSVSPDHKFTVTQEYIQQSINSALSSDQLRPDIAEKLHKMQRRRRTTHSTSHGAAPVTTQTTAVTQCDVDTAAASVGCAGDNSSVGAGARHGSSVRSEKRVTGPSLFTLLSRRKELLKREIRNKRRQMERNLISDSVATQKQQQQRVQQHVTVQQPAASEEREKSDVCIERDTPLAELTPPAAKRKRTAGRTPCADQCVSGKLYCVCRTPYDSTKFYVGCDMCGNWFHGNCVGISARNSRKTTSFVCEECQQAKESRQLFCVCRTEYDESRFYIGCDKCEDWFHGRCIGVLPSEGEKLDSYLCVKCAPDRYPNRANLMKISPKISAQLKRFMHLLINCRHAADFVNPVDSRIVPDYYRLIKSPIDLRTIDSRLQSDRYERMCDFLGDLILLIENCRQFNSPGTRISQAGVALEKIILSEIKKIRSRM